MLKTPLKILAALIVLSAVTLAIWYQIDGIPTGETSAYMEGTGFESTREADGGLLFTPDESNGHGIVIMHGALIKPRSYAKSAAYFAARGYTVYLPYGPGRMSIAAVDKTAQRISELEISDWFFIGHSMGGMASLEVVASDRVNTRAVALWATAMPSDFSFLDLPILFIWGDTDGLLSSERFQASQQNLPDAVRYLTLEGANHQNFAMYGHQFFDKEATISLKDQIDFANATTEQFFAGFL